MIGEWWQVSAIYQVYPRSFQDNNHDGTGDLQGIISRLAHFTELGVGTIWLSPVFTSPMADFGYDISDYRGIDPLFGTMHDFHELLAACHSAGLKVLLDLVPNHTSAQQTCTCPPSRSINAGGAPRYGTWTILTPAIILNNSPATCGTVPLPRDAMLILPGLDLA
jgi:hypothetical protein